jgi:integrase
LLLNSKNGNPITYDVLRRAFKEAAAKLGLDKQLKVHWARHAFAAGWLAANTILLLRKAIAARQVFSQLLMDTIMEQLTPELAELMGHVSFETTKLYLSRAREAVIAHLEAYPERAARLGYS